MLILLTGLSSCNKPINKFVTEPIPIDELKIIIEKDTLFEFTYKAAQKIRESKLTDDVEKAKWSDMTYKRVHDIALFYRDSNAQKKYTPQIKKDWEWKYGKHLIKADSISEYWKKYLRDNSIDNYAKIELFDIQESKVGLKVTPLKGTIDMISIYYSFIKKEEKEEILSFEKHPSIYKRKSFLYALPKTDKPKIIWEKDDEFKDILNNKLLEEVLDKYVFKFKISFIDVTGVRYENVLLKRDVPSDVKGMIANESDNMFEFYRAKVIQEYVSSDFIRFDKYKFAKIDSIASTLDLEAIRFLNLLDNDEDW